MAIIRNFDSGLRYDVKHYVVTVQDFFDPGIKGLTRPTFSPPRVVAVVDSVDEGFKLIDELGYDRGAVTSVADPIRVDGRLFARPAVPYLWERPDPKKKTVKKTTRTKGRK